MSTGFQPETEQSDEPKAFAAGVSRSFQRFQQGLDRSNPPVRGEANKLGERCRFNGLLTFPRTLLPILETILISH